jgi:DNA primase
MIPPELVDRVRESADLVQIIGEHVKLKRAGADFRGPCPFHGGKNPNFSVSPRRGMYHCFKCQESGNVFTFLQKHLGMSFPDAVRYVAATEGIEIPETRVERAGPDPREPLWEVNATAAEYFQNMLWNEPAGANARDYLAQRGITKETADKYNLGFAPREIGVFRAHMATLGFDENRLLESGLMVKRDDQTEPRPRFRDRLMIPILDTSGHYVAFGGRTLSGSDPKYLNSPETPAFSKGRMLYALNWTRNDIRKADRAFVVEGYFDAIRLMEAGLNTVVAPLGTALTDAQAELLGRYTKNVYLLYDSDQAGLKATFRAGDELLRHGMSVRVVTFPGGDDPDTFVQKHGAEGLEAQVAQAVDVFERKIQILDRGGWFSELQKKRRALDRLLPTIRATSDVLLRELYVARAAEKTGVAKDVLMREVGLAAPEPEAPRRASRASEPMAPRQREMPVRRGERRTNRAARGQAAERELIRAILAEPQRLAHITERIGADRFRDAHYRSIFEVLLENGEEHTPEQLADQLEPDVVKELDSLLAELDALIDPEQTVEASLADLEARELDERLEEIDRSISLATDAEKDELVKEKLRLHKEIELLGQPTAKGFKYLRGPVRP